MATSAARPSFGVDTFLKAVGLAGFGFVLLVLALLQMLLFYQKAGGVLQFLMASFAALSVVPFYTGLILLLDRHEKEPGWLLLGALLWGGVVATFFSLIFNSIGSAILVAVFGPRLGEQLSAPFVAPVVEETSKGLAVLLIFLLWRREFTNTVDGLVYGALAGLGFAATENILYFARFVREGGAGGLAVGFVIRAVLGGLSHSVYTACTGAGLGYARETRGVGRFLAPVVGYFCAMFLHFLWNFSATFALPAVARSAGNAALLMLPVMSFFIEGIPLLLLVVIAYFAWKREVAAIREGLADEVQAGTLSPEEVEVLTRPRERSRHLWQVLTTRGPLAWNAVRQLYDAQVDLAFALWRLRRGEPVEQDVQALRERVRVLRERARGMGVAA
ncbi:MAG: PrsW family intramembrane metalloprotease [Armatimonadota bacterium]|nr:PrsW family intramembrane metalloprotease [Armatimonadota bacterium]MDR7444368.1 PrsW family intramembrane metalloprotease [Armatimonadota bacterium]MDR7569641.1 PrsW family intramembrane metalloprotease [Armatimonadota bacterium]MDR7614855.1 PrsW family intramembrane metalloprotease [Armatimonadota bacterium]